MDDLGVPLFSENNHVEMNLVDIVPFTFFVSGEEINSLILGSFWNKIQGLGSSEIVGWLFWEKSLFAKKMTIKGGLRWPSMNEFGFIIPFF